MSWMEDFVPGKTRNPYYKNYRDNRKHKWHKIQLKWYYKNWERVKLGWKKPSSQAPDKYDEWLTDFDKQE